MDLDLRHLTGIIVISSGIAVLGLSYVAAYLLGKNAGRREMTEGRISKPVAPDELDRIESALSSIAVEVERLGEGQRYLLGNRGQEGVRSPEHSQVKRRHTTPV